jgi:hypothetical protein
LHGFFLLCNNLFLGRLKEADMLFWIPVAGGDRWQPRIDGVGRDPTAADFLRPARNSPLATSGAGVDYPALPPQVGAVPPVGTAEWDWDKTWKALAR